MFSTIYYVICFIFVFAIVINLWMKLTTSWCSSQTCLVGKTAIITGSNSGLGYETALDFAKRGARVILACRNEGEAEKARAKIIQETDNENVVVRLIDMSSFKSVRAFARRINKEEERLDILVNNAGVANFNARTEDGHVWVIQVNYLSAFLLTNLLIGLLKKTKSSRIVNVSSFVARYGWTFNVNKLDTHPKFFLLDYIYSKVCHILFTIELAKRLKGTSVTAYCPHPGIARTDIFRNTPKRLVFLAEFLKNYFFKTCLEGVQTIIFCSVAKGITQDSGKFFGECRKMSFYYSIDTKLSGKLWEVTQEMVKMTPEERL